MKEEIRHRELGHIMLRRHVEHLILQLQVDGIVLGMSLIHRLSVNFVQHVDRVLASLDKLLNGGLVVLEDWTLGARQTVDEFLARVAGALDLEGQGFHVLRERPGRHLIEGDVGYLGVLGGGHENVLERVEAAEEGGNGDVVEGEACVLCFVGHSDGNRSAVLS